MVLVWLVALLERVCDDDDAPGLEHPEHLFCHLVAHWLRDLMEQVRTRDDVKRVADEGGGLGAALHELGGVDHPAGRALCEVEKVAHVLPGLLKIVGGEVRGHGAHGRPVVLDKRVQAPRSARDLEEGDVCLVHDPPPEGHKLGDAHEARPLHRVLHAAEERLGRVLVRLGAARGQPPVRLPVEVLQVV
eukprot:CAMPEP_0174941034 /NCGR_PEP_ID=MMETSP1355-20121228/70713_1 /TAXON_ID=464990 /ORGANISM="Hemiselmis tepida, Strain CCMP443" /LENGTH=188 /DNA_ID=CAMNT_0016188117 /DNA_START=122 /DNA_END=684 /DNA_ORIENTATION=+